MHRARMRADMIERSGCCWAAALESIALELLHLRYCPCCGGTAICDPAECTFSLDSPAAAEEMELVRAALRSRPCPACAVKP